MEPLTSDLFSLVRGWMIIELKFDFTLNQILLSFYYSSLF